MTISLTDETFDEFIFNSGVPVLVDFWAEWCGPCKSMAPTIDELSRSMIGKVAVVKANVDHCPNKMIELSIRGIPALFIFNGGKVVAQHMGVLTRDQMLEFIEKNV